MEPNLNQDTRNGKVLRLCLCSVAVLTLFFNNLPDLSCSDCHPSAQSTIITVSVFTEPPAQTNGLQQDLCFAQFSNV